MKVLAEAIGTSYIEIALETYATCALSPRLAAYSVPRSATALTNADLKIQPPLQPLQVLHSVDLICHLWQQYVTDAIFPLASASVTVRRDMVVFNNQTVSRAEGAANAFLQKMIDCKFPSSRPCSLRLTLALDQQSSLGFPPSCQNKRRTILPLETMTSHSRASTPNRASRVVSCWRRLGTVQESV